jgi:DNA-binding PadR family transcriptional regulator
MVPRSGCFSRLRTKVDLPWTGGERSHLCLTSISSPDISIGDTSVATVVLERRPLQMAHAELQPQDLSPLPAAHLHILLALADGEKHGYAVMREVERMTDGEVTMGPGTLYGAIKRMLSAGLVEETEERPDPDIDDERRRYYRPTGLGVRVLIAETERLQRLVNTAQAKQKLRLEPGLEGR